MLSEPRSGQWRAVYKGRTRLIRNGRRNSAALGAGAERREWVGEVGDVNSGLAGDR